MLYGLLLSLNVLVCAALVLVVLMQRSEGGALGTGGGPAGMVSARGAGDLLTRTTWILFSLFLGLSLSLTLIGAHDRNEKVLLDRMKLAPGAPIPAGGAPAATPAPVGAPIAPLTPPGGLTSSSLPPPVAAPVVPPVPAPAARQEPARPQAAKPEAAKPEAAKPEAAKPAPAKPAAAKPAKAHSAAAAPAASAAASSAPAAAAPVITPPPPKADSDAGKTSAP